MSNRNQAKSEMQDSAVVVTLLEPFATLLARSDLYELVVNTPGEILTEGSDGWTRHDAPQLTFDRLMRLARAVASTSAQVIDDTRPVLSATLPGDERIQIVIPPAVTRGTVSVTIRKPSSVTLSLSELHTGGLFADVRPTSVASAADAELLELYDRGAWPEFLGRAVVVRKNILISGATGSGKTTLSKALIAKIPAHERVITIEDTPELVIPQPNHVRLFYSKGAQGLAKVDPKELLESCLRMRPDRILLQELRDGTAFYYIRDRKSVV